MAVYYVDPLLGRDDNEGTSADVPKQSYEKLTLLPGDTVLFKRGMLYRGALKMIGGADNAPITYGAYGEGEMPTFCGSTDVSDEADWAETDKKNLSVFFIDLIS